MKVDALMIYGWFRELVKVRVNHDSRIIYVSEASGCLRKAYYDRVSPSPTLDVTNIVLTIGNGIHRVLQQYLAKKGWKTEVEVRLKIKIGELVGHADLVAPDGTVVELKTVNEVPSKPYPNHVMQINAYLNMLRSKEGYIAYIGRDGRVKVFKVSPDRKLFIKLIKRANYLHYSLVNLKPPKPERSPLCNQCPYRWRCFREVRK